MVHKSAWAGLSWHGQDASLPGQDAGGDTSRPALFLEASNWQRWGVLCKPPLHWPYGTGTQAFYCIPLLILSTHNAQNSICNNFEGALAFSYESYTLELHIPDEGSQWGSLRAIISHFWVIRAPFGLGARFLCIETLVK